MTNVRGLVTTSAIALLGVALGCGQSEPPSGRQQVADAGPFDLKPPPDPDQERWIRDCPASDHVVVQTPCGATMRCGKTGKLGYVRVNDKWDDESPCLHFVEKHRSLLAERVDHPERVLTDVEPPSPYRDAALPDAGFPHSQESVRAYLEVEGKVASRAKARAGAIANPEERETWTRAMRGFGFERFETSRADPDTGHYFLYVFSSVGAPGAIPYWGIWRVDRAGQVRALAEQDDLELKGYWSVGDLDDDGTVEVALHQLATKTPERPGKVSLLDVRREAPMVLIDRVDTAAAPDATPRVIGVAMSSGRALLVENDLLRYAGGKVEPAPQAWKDELAGRLKGIQETARAALALLDQELPPKVPGRCADAPRLVWAADFSSRAAAVVLRDAVADTHRAALIALDMKDCLPGLAP